MRARRSCRKLGKTCIASYRTAPNLQVDILVTECFGYFLLYESRLESVIACRDRFLAPDGLMSAPDLRCRKPAAHGSGNHEELLRPSVRLLTLVALRSSRSVSASGSGAAQVSRPRGATRRGVRGHDAAEEADLLARRVRLRLLPRARLLLRRAGRGAGGRRQPRPQLAMHS